MKDGTDGVSNQSGRMLILARQTGVVCLVVGLIVLTALGLASAIDVVLMIFTGLLFAIFLHSLSCKFDHYTRFWATWSLVVARVACLWHSDRDEPSVATTLSMCLRNHVSHTRPVRWD